MAKEVFPQEEIKMLIIKRTKTSQPTFITLRVLSQSLLLTSPFSLVFAYLLILHTLCGNFIPDPCHQGLSYHLLIYSTNSQICILISDLFLKLQIFIPKDLL